MTHASDTAFPFQKTPTTEPEPGLSKREYLAALAMHGLLADSGREWAPDDLAYDACVYADALMNALNKED